MINPDDKKISKKYLTRIPDMYTLSPTQNESEADRILIKNFLDTLAEVALSIASREDGEGKR